MSNVIDRLFRDFDEGRISRRELNSACWDSRCSRCFGRRLGTGHDDLGRGRGRGNRPPADDADPYPGSAISMPPAGTRCGSTTSRTGCTDYTKAVPGFTRPSWVGRSAATTASGA